MICQDFRLYYIHAFELVWELPQCKNLSSSPWYWMTGMALQSWAGGSHPFEYVGRHKLRHAIICWTDPVYTCRPGHGGADWSLTRRSKGSVGARAGPSACGDRSGGGPPRPASFSPHFTGAKLYDCFSLLILQPWAFIRSLPPLSVVLMAGALHCPLSHFMPESAHVGPPQL